MRWHAWGILVARCRAAYQAFEFHGVHRALVDYVTGELSAVYLDVVKDRLYSEAPNAPARRAAQAVIYQIVRTLATLTAPIMCFTSEDIWTHLPKRAGDPDSVHLAEMPEGEAMAEDDPLAQTFAVLLAYRDAATKELEAFRAEKHKSVDARVVIQPLPAHRELLTPRLTELADLFIVSDVVLGDDAAGDAPVVTVEMHPGSRCERCWKMYETMNADNPDLCDRCAGAVAAVQG